MRIGFSCIGLGSLQRGGELIVSQLAHHLASRGHEVVVYQAGPAGAEVRYRPRVVPTPFRFYDLTAPSLALSTAALNGRLRRWVALGSVAGFAGAVHADALRSAYDVFVVQHAWPEASLLPLLQRRGIRTVALGNGPLINDARMVCSSLDAFVATNPVQAAWARYFHAAPVSLMRMGVDLQRFQQEGDVIPAVRDLPAPRVMLCGALIPIKRVELAIAALARLGRGSLILVGDGPLRPALLAAAQQHLPGRHLCAGSVPHRELPLWYRAADILAFPSSPAETAGQVLLEAMACGTPVVATDDSIRRWLIGDGGRTVDVEDAGRFAAAIEESADPPQASTLRARARAQAERCSWDGVAQAFSEMCEDLLSGRPVRRSYGLEEDASTQRAEPELTMEAR